MTADAREGSVDRELDEELRALFAIAPSPATMTMLNAAAATRLAAWQPSRRTGRRHTGRRVLVGLLAAAVLLGGATGNLQSLYFLAMGPFDLPWNRGVAVGQSQVVDGYRVTIDRAFADSTRLALAISVVDEQERPGTTQVRAFATIVTDEGGEYGGLIGTSRPDGAYAAVNVAWKTPSVLPLPSGPRRLHVVIPSIGVRSDQPPPADADATGWSPWREHPGPWVFDIELDVEGGTTLLPDVSATVHGATVTVSRVIAAPGMVRAELRLNGLEGDWSPVGSIEHDGRRLSFVVGSNGSDGVHALMTDGGYSDTSGGWTITIDRLVGAGEDRVGPWILEFTGR